MKYQYIFLIINVYKDLLTEDEFKKIMYNFSLLPKNILSSNFDHLLQDIDLEFKKTILSNFMNNKEDFNAAINYIFYNNSNDYIDLIIDQLDKVIENPKLYNVLLINNTLKKKLGKLDNSSINIVKDKIDKLNKIINVDSEIYVKQYLKEFIPIYYNTNNSKNHDFFNNIIDIIYLIIKELTEFENTEICNLNEIGSGSFSKILNINNKIIKIGITRKNLTFPNNPFINKMILRKEFKNEENVSIFIEVCDKLDTKSNVTEEELYQLYKNLRDIGIIWTDIDFDNVGRLTKPNNVSWKQELPLTDERLGLTSYRNSSFIPKIGDIVIIDNDYLFNEDDPNIIVGRHKFYDQFKKRYDLEKKNEFVKISSLNIEEDVKENNFKKR